MSQMPPDVQARIRQLPGNNVCCDCSNVNPQWASVSYGCLMCLECSGHHRSLGVHLSFVRSIAMDSWSERQIQAMEKSGGNQALVDFFQSKGIKKSTSIPTKYGTKQAQYFRERLTRWLDGRREPPPDPGNYNPETGVSDAQGAEPLPGETTEEYNARQARLREDARARMRAKFGDGGMSGLGSSGAVSWNGEGQGSGGGFDDDWSSKLVGAAKGAGSFFKEKVIDNDRVRSTAGAVANSGAVSKVSGVVGGLLGKVIGGGGGETSPVNLEGGRTLAQQEKELWDSMYQKPAAAPEPVPPARTMSAPTGKVMWNDSSEGFSTSTLNRATSSPFQSTAITATTTPKKAQKDDFSSAFDDWDDDDWGDSKKKAPPAPTPAVRAKAEPPPASTFQAEEAKSTPVPSKPNADDATTPPKTNGYHAAPAPAPAPAPQPVKLAPVKAPVAEPKPAPKKAAAVLKSADDFFADFGM